MQYRLLGERSDSNRVSSSSRNTRKGQQSLLSSNHKLPLLLCVLVLSLPAFDNIASSFTIIQHSSNRGITGGQNVNANVYADINVNDSIRRRRGGANYYNMVLASPNSEIEIRSSSSSSSSSKGSKGSRYSTSTEDKYQNMENENSSNKKTNRKNDSITSSSTTTNGSSESTSSFTNGSTATNGSTGSKPSYTNGSSESTQSYTNGSSESTPSYTNGSSESTPSYTNGSSESTPSFTNGSSDKTQSLSKNYFSDNNNNNNNNNNNISSDPITPTDIKTATEKVKSMTSNNKNKRRRKKYKRKRPKTQSEKDRDMLKRKRQRQYEQLMSSSSSSSSGSNVNGVNGNAKNNESFETNKLWAFEALFPEPGWDNESIHRDLYGVKERDAKIKGTSVNGNTSNSSSNKKDDDKGATSKKRTSTSSSTSSSDSSKQLDAALSKKTRELIGEPALKDDEDLADAAQAVNNTKIDRSLTRMVEDRLYGFRRGQMGEFQYDTSLMGDGAVKFRDGVRLGNALTVNVDRLTYFAKREMIHGKLEEAEELYETAMSIAPQDGRPYLGLAKIAERRRDFKTARKCLRAGIAKSRLEGSSGGNPFLLQALGVLEEKSGHLSEAENLYLDAAKSRPSHAAAWVSLAQLRTRKLRQGPNAGRECYQTAERELKKAGLKKSTYVYTAWAALENKAGDTRKARELFKKALDIDPKCSAAWLQLGVMEANEENWDEAKDCFETVLKFDKRNSRVLQAYALMETKRPDGDSRDAIGLFEKALKAKPRDGGVLQAYALYVAKLGDIDSARNLLKRGTEIDKRHAPLWQAWGVLETRHGNASDAREVFQQGIWACAQPSGGQSGGRHCARLWQAWGVLEAQEYDYAAARRCFSRALDADKRNVAAITAWTLMEQELGQYNDAKLIFERALRQFSPSSNEKIQIWRAYELMETEAGNSRAAQNVYQRAFRDSLRRSKPESIGYKSNNTNNKDVNPSSADDVLTKSSEVEVSSWKSRESFGDRDVWMKDGSIEGKVPTSTMKNTKVQKPKRNDT